MFVGSDNGFVYSLDAKTGCVYWSFETGSIIRNAITVGAVTGQGARDTRVYFGDGHANVFALDAQNGQAALEDESRSRTSSRASPRARSYYDGKLFVPVSSSEEFSSGNPGYPCCTSRGSVVALDANTGKQIWKAWVVPEEPKPYKTMANGVDALQAGRRRGLEFADDRSREARGLLRHRRRDDGAVAEDDGRDHGRRLDTGKLLWSYQATENDVFMGGCNGPNNSEACPKPIGPGHGHRQLADPQDAAERQARADRRHEGRGRRSRSIPIDNGKLLYRDQSARARRSAATARGRASIVWGGAADDQHVYYGIGGAGSRPSTPATGERVWLFAPPAPRRRRHAALARRRADGDSRRRVRRRVRRHALRAVGGRRRKLWEFPTAKEFETVNNVQPAHGGAIATSGAVVVDGMVFVGSGYAVGQRACGGNVLLAFGAE